MDSVSRKGLTGSAMLSMTSGRAESHIQKRNTKTNSSRPVKESDDHNEGHHECECCHHHKKKLL